NLQIQGGSAVGDHSSLGPRSMLDVRCWMFDVRFWYCLSLLLFACGLMSKPMLVTLPFVLLLLDYWPLNRMSSAERRAPGDRSPITSYRSSVMRLLWEKLPFFALAAASSIVTLHVQQ